MAFLNVFFGTGGLPSINLANVRIWYPIKKKLKFTCIQTCNPTDNATFPGTTLPDCASLADDIKACQKKGKIVTLSLGGATGSVGFTDDSQASDFADQIWNLFLGILLELLSATLLILILIIIRWLLWNATVWRCYLGWDWLGHWRRRLNWLCSIYQPHPLSYRQEVRRINIVNALLFIIIWP